MMFKSTTLICLAMLVLGSASGCNLFRKSKKPKQNPAIAAELETDFRQRWIDRRAAELTAQGMEGPAAGEQAVKDFSERFPYVGEQKQK
jgi:hypothetical protein